MKKELHGLLQKQIDRHFKINGNTDIPKEINGFLTSVNNSYLKFENERLELEKSLNLSSEELTQTNSDLQISVDELESKIKERTSELEKTNLELKKEIEERKKVESDLIGNLVKTSKISKYEAIISSVSQSVHQSLKLDDVLEYAVDSISKNIDSVMHVTIYLVEGNDAVMQVHRGFTKNFIKRASVIPKGIGLIWKTIEDNKTLFVLDTSRDKVIGPAGKRMGISSYISVPLCHESNVVGVLALTSSEVNGFSEEDLKLAEIVAQQVQTAIDNARKAEALKQYASKLERSNEELEQFAYVASHDLQEPLRMVGSYLGLLERRYKDKLDNDATDFIYYAVDGAKRMQVLINDLLSYSRVSTRGKPFEIVSCSDLVKGVLKDLEVAIKESGAEIKLGRLPDQIFADKTQISQLIQNLTGNALKFCKKRKPKIEISAKDNGKSWIFAVKDNGIGIEPEYFDKIFAIFQRLHGKAEFAGTGIGLAICKKIVLRHDGNIWVESKPGEGSTFYFTIPKRGGTQL